MPSISTRFLPAVLAALMLTAGHPAQAGMGAGIGAGLGANWEESGLASWYGGGFEGRRTSSGEVFSPYAMTAAHDTLPLGTRILVTTQETGRSVVVTITDRMPPKRTRVIDLSRAAARELGIISAGVGMVTLSQADRAEPVEVAEASDEGDGLSPRRHGPRHRHHGARTVSARHGYYPARFAARVQR